MLISICFCWPGAGVTSFPHPQQMFRHSRNISSVPDCRNEIQQNLLYKSGEFWKTASFDICSMETSAAGRFNLCPTFSWFLLREWILSLYTVQCSGPNKQREKKTTNLRICLNRPFTLCYWKSSSGNMVDLIKKFFKSYFISSLEALHLSIWLGQRQQRPGTFESHYIWHEAGIFFWGFMALLDCFWALAISTFALLRVFITGGE